LPPSSSDSPPPSATRSSPPESSAIGAPAPLVWRTNAWLFLATVGSVFLTQYTNDGGDARARLFHATQFTAALLTILLAHEFGHYIAARVHKVDASLPFFIPLPLLSPFGTMGAVIRMRGVIPTRKALLDIGASGPLAGLVFAIPMYFWGIAHSKLVPVDGSADGLQLGESVLTRVVEHFATSPIPDGMDIALSPVAFAAWAGMFVTMINLLPVGQLDGGHVAYALLGTKQDRAAVVVHRSMLAFFFVSLASYLFRDLRAGMGLHRIGSHVNNAMFWLVWFEVIAILGTLSSRMRDAPPGPGSENLTIPRRAVATLLLALFAGIGREKSTPGIWIAWFIGLATLIAMEIRGGALRKHSLFDHPPAGTAPLGAARTIIAVVTLALFALLFMPTPISM
jgi:hypothetical protein